MHLCFRAVALHTLGHLGGPRCSTSYVPVSVRVPIAKIKDMQPLSHDVGLDSFRVRVSYKYLTFGETSTRVSRMHSFSTRVVWISSDRLIHPLCRFVQSKHEVMDLGSGRATNAQLCPPARPSAVAAAGRLMPIHHSILTILQYQHQYQHQFSWIQTACRPLPSGRQSGCKSICAFMHARRDAASLCITAIAAAAIALSMPSGWVC